MKAESWAGKPRLRILRALVLSFETDKKIAVLWFPATGIRTNQWQETDTGEIMFSKGSLTIVVQLVLHITKSRD
jgi:hypothetical protein